MSATYKRLYEPTNEGKIKVGLGWTKHVPEIGSICNVFPSKTCLDQSYCSWDLGYVVILRWQGKSQVKQVIRSLVLTQFPS